MHSCASLPLPPSPSHFHGPTFAYQSSTITLSSKNHPPPALLSTSPPEANPAAPVNPAQPSQTHARTHARPPAEMAARYHSAPPAPPRCLNPLHTRDRRPMPRLLPLWTFSLTRDPDATSTQTRPEKKEKTACLDAGAAGWGRTPLCVLWCCLVLSWRVFFSGLRAARNASVAGAVRRWNRLARRIGGSEVLGRHGALFSGEVDGDEVLMRGLG
ncbi:hypothetical protein PMIN01_10346 [Paraphaeosphaeria minitans]|uniref:Uncharacterized protein n=1 Tax=Paraphaeosphaeria minitans TaxID=565426 RepID=A0A9P6GBS7_9PLEO|nr:hypothetical protein PMIN01_10346 [Paraphaeosphaeria minitans]